MMDKKYDIVLFHVIAQNVLYMYKKIIVYMYKTTCVFCMGNI